MYYEDYFIDIRYGGKVQWCYSKRFKEWSLRLLYYKVRSIKQLKAQVTQLQVSFLHSSFVSHERGLHWHRAPRLRRN